MNSESEIYMEDLTVVMVWHEETDLEKIEAFNANFNSFRETNPEIEVIVIKNIFSERKLAWFGTDLTFFKWYVESKADRMDRRFLLVEWDCWCNCDLKAYFSKVYDNDLVVPNIKYPERDDWFWFSTIEQLPQRARVYATGITPMCAVLISQHAAEIISGEILKEEYLGLNSELRLGTIATMLGFDPIINPTYNRTIGWRNSEYPLRAWPGLHHPRKKLTQTT